MAKLILTHEVTGLGAAGDVVEVKDGYARNYLLPRDFALTWSKGGEKQVESIKAARAAREHASLEDAQKQAAALSAKPVKLIVKAGETGRLFGTVKQADVADAVEAAGLGAHRQAQGRTAGAHQVGRFLPGATSVCTTTFPL